ncbi:Dam family site-specific DNA-(adenine-N6)-methyltransferase (plasmid) [Geobacillus stearothermophilus]|nr:Dam family site-specific DNA-(adenine-N6)-methyltransferase [Geobacillus stearothermophilus]
MKYFLPRRVEKVQVPPIKCQGIKTKLVDFISQNIKWDGSGRWIEPFLGSGVVLFNINPERALVSDTNIHIINFYKDIQEGRITAQLVRQFLEEHGEILRRRGQEYYYEVRDRFNKSPNSLDFLFLNRSCFNGVIRFNRYGKYNVPFGHKPERFSRAYITKIVNQVDAISKIMLDKDWVFIACDWRETLSMAQKNDFVYLDPPYVGRHTDYFNQWTDEDAVELANVTKGLPCGFALSMWLENKYRRNEHIDSHWSGLVVRTQSHFYHVGSSESLRNSMEEALVIKPTHASENTNQVSDGFGKTLQMSLFEDGVIGK